MTATGPDGTAVAHLFFAPLLHASRLWRAAEAAMEAEVFGKVLFFGYRPADGPEPEPRDPRCIFVRPRLRPWGRLPRPLARALQYAEWNARIAVMVLSARPVLIQCHGLPSLPLAVALRLILRRPLLYDAHELESERHDWPRRTRRLARSVEQALIRRADHVTVVSNSIRHWYRRAYGIERITTVLNAAAVTHPGSEAVPSLRARLGLTPRERLYVYVGLLGPGRGVEAVLAAFARAAPGNHVAFVGYGPLVETVRASAGTCTNVHYVEAIPSRDVVPFIRDADVGLIIIERGGGSHEYCMPNKLFESINAGLPVLCSGLTELSRFVGQHRCGWLTEPSAWAILDFVDRLGGDDLTAARQRVAALQGRFTWDVEKHKLLEIYRFLLARRRRGQAQYPQAGPVRRPDGPTDPSDSTTCASA